MWVFVWVCGCWCVGRGLAIEFGSAARPENHWLLMFFLGYIISTTYLATWAPYLSKILVFSMRNNKRVFMFPFILLKCPIWMVISPCGFDLLLYSSASDAFG